MFLALVLIAALESQQAPATTASAPSTPNCPSGSSYGALHTENDSWLGASTDDAYTQGLEFRRDSARWRPSFLHKAAARFWNANDGDQFTDGCSESLGQTMFTPRNVIGYSPSSADRPFGAFLYYSVAGTRYRSEQIETFDGATLRPRLLSVGVTVGLTGSLAGGRETQAGTHLLREHRLAKGWLTSQLPNRPEFNLEASNYQVVAAVSPSAAWGGLADLAFGQEVTIGTTQTYAGGSAFLRIGRGLSGLPIQAIKYSATESSSKDFEVSGLLGGRFRGVFHNSFVSGSFGAATGLKQEMWVPELHWGLDIRYRQWRFSYRIVRRRSEFDPLPIGYDKWHNFSMVDAAAPAFAGDFGWAQGTRLGLRFGEGDTNVRPGFPSASNGLLASGLSAEKELWRGLTVGFEINGTAKETGPSATDGSHRDLLLLAKDVTLGYEWAFAGPENHLQLRGGAGLAAVKSQFTPETGSLLEPVQTSVTAKGRSAVFGVRYSRQLGWLLSLTADAVYAWLGVDGEQPRNSHFSTITLGFQLHPFGRNLGDPQRASAQTAVK